MKRTLQRNAPAITLFFLSPAIAEMLLGHEPPPSFFKPISLVINTFLYGAAALLAREAVRSRGKGYPSLLLLGAAYGIFEEGLVAMTVFNPGSATVGNLAVFGRALGVNWVWAVWLTLYHMLVSIALPVMLVEVVFPHRRRETWLGRPWRIVLWGMLAFEATCVSAFFGRILHFFPPPPQYLTTWVVIFLLVWLAPRLPSRLNLMAGRPAGHPFWLWLIGFLWFPLSIVTFTRLTTTGIPPLGVIALGLAVFVLAGILVIRLSGDFLTWDDRGRFLLIVGALTVFILLAPVRESSSHPEKNQAGSTAVAMIAAGLLIWQGKRVWARARLKNAPQGARAGY